MRASLAVAFALLVLHAALVIYGPRPHEARFQSGDQLNRHVVEQYAHRLTSSSRGTVLVGSSMTAHLEFGPDDCAYNLALTGESSLTGLQILADLAPQPRQVLVEINVPERGVNKAVVDQSTRRMSWAVPMLEAQNMPVNLLFSFLSDLRPRRSPSPSDDATLARALVVQTQEYAKEIPGALLEANILRMTLLVHALERQGTRVAFFELPIHPSLEKSPRAQQIRAAFASAFPFNRLIRSDDLSAGMLFRTLDGVHLSPDEAAVVTKALRSAYPQACPAPATTT